MTVTPPKVAKCLWVKPAKLWLTTQHEQNQPTRVSGFDL